MKCQNCGSYDYAEHDLPSGAIKHVCDSCGDVTILESYRDEGQDKWRDVNDRDRW